MNRTT